MIDTSKTALLDCFGVTKEQLAELSNKYDKGSLGETIVAIRDSEEEQDIKYLLFMHLGTKLALLTVETATNMISEHLDSYADKEDTGKQDNNLPEV